MTCNEIKSTRGLFLVGRRHWGKRPRSITILKTMKERGFLPPGRSDVSAVKLHLPFDWKQDPFHDSNWKMQVHAWRMLDPLILGYESDKNVEALRVAVDIALDWLGWVVAESRDVGRAWYDMAVGLRAAKLAYLKSSIMKEGFGAREVDRIESAIILHIGRLLEKKKFNRGNHGIFQANGLRALSYVLGTDNALSKLAGDQGQQFLEILIHSQFDQQGMHREGAVEYHFFALEKFEELLGAEWWAGEDLGILAKKVRMGRRRSHWLCVPDGTEMMLGDTGGRQRFSKEGLLKRVKSSVDFASFDNGYNIAREIRKGERGSWLVFFRTAYSSAVHCHVDRLSIIFWVDGSYVVEDPGKYGYRKDAARRYVVSEKSHNALHFYDENLVDVVRPSENCLVDREECENYVKWRAVQRQQKACFERTVVVVPSVGVAVADRGICEEKRAWAINWTIGRNKEVNILNEGKELLLEEEGRRSIKMCSFDGDLKPCEFSVGKGEVFPDMAGWVSGRGYKTLEPSCAAYERGMYSDSIARFTLFFIDGEEGWLTLDNTPTGIGLVVQKGEKVFRVGFF